MLRQRYQEPNFDPFLILSLDNKFPKRRKPHVIATITLFAGSSSVVSMSTPGQPTLLFGGGTVGNPEISQLTDVESVSGLIGKLSELGINHIDTAARYPDGYNGQSEELFGLSGAGAKGFVIDTKILVRGREVAGSLGLDAVRKSVPDSLERLKVSRVNTLYAHAPDPTTPLEEQVRALDEQYKKGVCNQVFM